MKNPFRTRYRIVTDGYLGYQAEFRWWWWPFYTQCDFSNTSRTIEQAERYIPKVVRQY